MLKKIVFAASAAALVLGAGTAALATAGSTGSPSASNPPSASGSAHAGPGAAGTPSPSGTSGAGSGATPGAAAPGASARDAKARKPALRALGRALHAEWVTRDRDNENAFVTHHAIRGEVTAVSATSVTVKALDGFTQTYAVTSHTKVHLRKNLQGQGQGKGKGQGRGGAAGTISDVRVGDKVAVTGVGTSSLSATHVVDATN